MLAKIVKNFVFFSPLLKSQNGSGRFVCAQKAVTVPFLETPLSALVREGLYVSKGCLNIKTGF